MLTSRWVESCRDLQPQHSLPNDDGATRQAAIAQFRKRLAPPATNWDASTWPQPTSAVWRGT